MIELLRMVPELIPEKVKEVVVGEFAIPILVGLSGVINFFNKVDDTLDAIHGRNTKDFYAIETMSAHRIVTNKYIACLVSETKSWKGVENRKAWIIVRPRMSFFKEWICLSEKEVPDCFKILFDKNCTKEERKRLLNKIMGLKAFW